MLITSEYVCVCVHSEKNVNLNDLHEMSSVSSVTPQFAQLQVTSK